MRRFDMDPEARMDLYATMEAFLGYVKSVHAALGTVMADVAALRDLVFDDPVEVAGYRASLKVLGAAKPSIDEAMRNFDDSLEEFVSSQRWEN